MATVEIPSKILEKYNKLYELCQEKDSVSVREAAKLLDMSEEALRSSVYRGGCTFGLGYAPDRLHSGFAKIPSLALYNFMTQCAMFRRTS